MTRTEEQENSLLDDLLEDVPEQPTEVNEFDLASLFESQDEALQFFQQLPTHILNLWANNDKVIHIITPPGASAAVKAVVDRATLQNLQTELAQVYSVLKEMIQYSEHPEEKSVRIITLKQAINAQEIMSVHSWSNDPKIELYEALRKRNLVIQPTMEELRILALVDTLLEIRENSTRVVVPNGRLPNIVR